MIAKKFRLSEKDLRKVFAQKKPFFSYMMIANVRKNSLSHARVGILLSAKITRWSVNRNFFRRLTYEVSKNFLSLPFDIVFVIKKGNQLSFKNKKDCDDFIENLSFIYKKISAYSYESSQNS